jgi:hypothetical protein
LQSLEAVEAGLSPRDSLEQSSCVVFKAGRANTFDGEVFCRAKSGLRTDLTGAAPGKRLLEAVRGLPDDEVGVSVAGERLTVAGRHDRSWVRFDPTVLLPLDAVERPAKADWADLPPEFADGLNTVAESAGKDEATFVTTCVHVHPKYVEATDGFSYAKYRVRTGVSGDTLIRAASARAVAKRGPSRFAETPDWLHYRGGDSFVSVRRYAEKYLDLRGHVGVRGKPAKFPKAAVAAIARLEVFSRENADDNLITVELKRGRVKLWSLGVTGGAEYGRGVKVDYDGPAVAFQIGPATLAKMVERHAEVEVAEAEQAGSRVTRLVVVSGKLYFLACVQEPGNNGKEGVSDGEKD